MCFDGDTPAGIGALYERDGIATVEFGATAPAFRGRGSQGALLARRLERALDLGCREIFTTTGVAVPGDPQHSYKNILRMGFREDYVRENWGPERR
jgi:GNAT superfamily N-acetyltransferase